MAFKKDITSQQRLPAGTLRFGSLKFIYATSGKDRDIAEKKRAKKDLTRFKLLK